VGAAFAGEGSKQGLEILPRDGGESRGFVTLLFRSSELLVEVTEEHDCNWQGEQFRQVSVRMVQDGETQRPGDYCCSDQKKGILSHDFPPRTFDDGLEKFRKCANWVAIPKKRPTKGIPGFIMPPRKAQCLPVSGDGTVQVAKCFKSHPPIILFLCDND